MRDGAKNSQRQLQLAVETKNQNLQIGGTEQDTKSTHEAFIYLRDGIA